MSELAHPRGEAPPPYVRGPGALATYLDFYVHVDSNANFAGMNVLEMRWSLAPRIQSKWS